MNRSQETLALLQVGPRYGHNEAYEQGKTIGRITVWVVVAAILLWGVYTFFKRS